MRSRDRLSIYYALEARSASPRLPPQLRELLGELNGWLGAQLWQETERTHGPEQR